MLPPPTLRVVVQHSFSTSLGFATTPSCPSTGAQLQVLTLLHSCSLDAHRDPHSGIAPTPTKQHLPKLEQAWYLLKTTALVHNPQASTVLQQHSATCKMLARCSQHLHNTAPLDCSYLTLLLNQGLMCPYCNHLTCLSLCLEDAKPALQCCTTYLHLWIYTCHPT